MKEHKKIKKVISILFWVFIWQLASFIEGNGIIMPGPVEVLREMFNMIQSAEFFENVLFSVGLIMLGFLCALILGYILALVSYKVEMIKELLKPAVTAMKSVPVAGIVVILLIWFGSKMLAVYIAFLVAFPQIYTGVSAGLEAAPASLLEVARVYGLKGIRKYCLIYRPAIAPYLNSALKICVGMSFKSGIAAELIGLPEHSIGEGMYIDKLYLNTAGVFVWMLTAMLISCLCEKLILYVVALPDVIGIKVRRNAAVTSKKNTKKAGETLAVLEKVAKKYDDRSVLSNVNIKVSAGKKYCILGKSGSGKTTLMRILAGLEEITDGTICVTGKSSLAFQENRLFDNLNIIENILAVSDNLSKENADEYIRKAYHGESVPQKASQLSGGMKKRCEVLRALLSSADMVLLDEPFAGLDDTSRNTMIEIIDELMQGRCLIYTAHNENTDMIPDSEIIYLDAKE